MLMVSDYILKPCPFCGNKKSVHAYTYKDAVYRQYAVKCNKCGARIMGASTELAIDKWNRRAERTVKAIRKPEAFFYRCECGYGLCCEKNDMNYCPSCGARLEWE